jgi:hypothetical protein
MNSRWTFLLAVVLFIGCLHPIFGADKQSCPVTNLPDKPFVPPEPYVKVPGAFFGTAALWMPFSSNWDLRTLRKIPFRALAFDFKKEGRPRLTVAARRLDDTGALVWSRFITSGRSYSMGFEDRAMITGLDLPSPGCWEFNAHYENPDYTQNLTFVAWIEP